MREQNLIDKPRGKKAAEGGIKGLYYRTFFIVVAILVSLFSTLQAQESDEPAQSILPTVTPTPVVVTATPTPLNVFIAAGLLLEATANAQTTGTATPTPDNWITATPTNTKMVITNTPVPGNEATATLQARLGTAVALTTGTLAPDSYVTATDTAMSDLNSVVLVATPTPTNPPPTATPVPVTPQPTATPQLLVAVDPVNLAVTPTATPTYPPDLVGKILFQGLQAQINLLGRVSRVNFFSINPDGSGLAALRPQWNWAYYRALERDEYAANRQFRAYVKHEQDYKRRKQTYIFYDFFTYGTSKQLTFFGDNPAFPYEDAPPGHVDRDAIYGAWDPAWSPTAEKVAFVSNTTGNDEIWVVERDIWPGQQLTRDNIGAWDRHPSWSPDGSQIVFFSTRTGIWQIWIMDADGSNQRQVTHFDWPAWNPVWVKYRDS